MLSNEYQHDGVQMVFKDLCVLVLWTKVALALEWLTFDLTQSKELRLGIQSPSFQTQLVNWLVCVSVILFYHKLY